MKKLIKIAVMMTLALGIIGCGQSVEEAVLSAGETTDSAYTNEFFNVKFEGDKWYLANSEELQQISNYTSDSMDNDDFEKLVESGTAAYIMYAVDNATGDTVNMIVQKLPTSLVKDVDIMEAALPSLEEQLTGALGASNVNTEITKTTVFGEERNCMVMDYDVQGTHLYQKQVYEVKGKFYLIITATAIGEDRTDELLADLKRMN